MKMRGPREVSDWATFRSEYDADADLCRSETASNDVVFWDHGRNSTIALRMRLPNRLGEVCESTPAVLRLYR